MYASTGTVRFVRHWPEKGELLHMNTNIILIHVIIYHAYLMLKNLENDGKNYGLGGGEEVLPQMCPRLDL